MYDWIKPMRPKAADAGIQAVIEDARRLYSMYEDGFRHIESVKENDPSFAPLAPLFVQWVTEARERVAGMIRDLEAIDEYFATRTVADNIRYRQHCQGDQE